MPPANKPPRPANAKQLAFARRIVEGKSQSEAYRELYQPNCTDKTAAETGCKMAANPKVKAEIARLRSLTNVKTILSLNDRLGILAKIAQQAPRDADAVRAVEVYSKISGDQAPDRHEVTGKGGEPLQAQVAVTGAITASVVRMSVRDRIAQLKAARERDRVEREKPAPEKG